MIGRFGRGVGILVGALVLLLVGFIGYQIGVGEGAGQVVTVAGPTGAAVPVYVGHAGWGWGWGWGLGFGFFLFPLFFFLLLAFALRPRWGGHGHGHGPWAGGHGHGPWAGGPGSGPWAGGRGLPPDDPRVQWVAEAHRRLHEADAGHAPSGGTGSAPESTSGPGPTPPAQADTHPR